MGKEQSLGCFYAARKERDAAVSATSGSLPAKSTSSQSLERKGEMKRKVLKVIQMQEEEIRKGMNGMNHLSKKLVKHIQDLRNLLPQLDWNQWDRVWMIQRQFLPMRPIFRVEILKCLTQYPELLHWNLRMIA